MWPKTLSQVERRGLCTVWSKRNLRTSAFCVFQHSEGQAGLQASHVPGFKSKLTFRLLLAPLISASQSYRTLTFQPCALLPPTPSLSQRHYSGCVEHNRKLKKKKKKFLPLGSTGYETCFRVVIDLNLPHTSPVLSTIQSPLFRLITTTNSLENQHWCYPPYGDRMSLNDLAKVSGAKKQTQKITIVLFSHRGMWM